MGKYRFAPLLLCAVGICTALGSTASAIRISNVTASGESVLFEDDFENISPACSVVFGSDSGDYDPSPSVGSYTIDEASPQDLQVCDSTSSPDLGPFQGSNYLRLHRSAGFKATYTDFATTPTSGLIHIESMVGLTDGVAIGPLGLFDGETLGIYFKASSAEGVMNYTGSYAAIYYDANGVYTSSSTGTTPLTFAPDTWHQVELDYTLGASTYSLTIDDITVTGLPVKTTLNSATRARLTAGGTGAEKAYYDHVPTAVPEPSTLALILCSGLSGLFFVRRRYRHTFTSIFIKGENLIMKRTAIFLIATLAMIASNAAHAAIDDNLLLLTPDFVSTGGYGYWQDVSGNGYHSTGVSLPPAYDGTVNLGGNNRSTAIDMTQMITDPGSDMYIVNGNNQAFNPGVEDYSISFWYNQTDPTGWQHVIAMGSDSSGTPGYSVHISAGQPGIRMDSAITINPDDRLAVYAGTGDISANGWHHVAAIFDRTITGS